MAYEKQIEDFAESKATWLSYAEVPGVHAKQLVRGWKAVSDVEKAENTAYLNAYVSPKNGSPSRTITDPQADGSGTLEGGALKNVFTGLWRHVRTTWNRETQVYEQTLRFGYATTLVWDESILVTGSGEDEADRAIQVRWNNLNPSYVDDIIRALNAGTLATIQRPDKLIENPVIGDVFEGLWAIASVEPTWAEDGSGVITITMKRAYEVDSLADLQAMDPERLVLREVTHPFGYAGDRDEEHLEKSFRRVIRLTYKGISPDSRAFLEALTGTECHTLLGNGWDLLSHRVEDDKAGGIVFIVEGGLVSRRTWVSDPEIPDADVTRYSELGNRRPQRARLYMGYKKEQQADIVADLLPGGAGDNITGFYVSSVLPSDNDDGSIDVVQSFSSYDYAWDEDEEPRFALLADGKTIETRPTPTDKTGAGYQVRFHYVTVERMYTNSIYSARRFAGFDQETGTTWSGDPCYPPFSNSLTDSRYAVYGYVRAREKGSTKYVSYRYVRDVCTEWQTGGFNPYSEPPANIEATE